MNEQPLVECLSGETRGTSGVPVRDSVHFHDLHRLFNDARDLFQRQDYPAAVQAWKRLLRIEPVDSAAWNNLGSTFIRLGDIPEAEDAFTKALHSDPQNADALNNLGNICRDRGEFAPAVEYYERAIRIRPEFVECLNNIAIAMCRQGRFTEAFEYYRRSINLDPRRAETWNNLAIVHAQLDEFAEAERDLNEALRLRPDYPDAHANLGLIWDHQGEFDRAAAHYHQAIRLKPHAANFHLALGNVLARRGQFDEAVVCFQRSLTLAPDYVEAMCSLGNALRDRGDTRAAIEVLEHAVKLRPDIGEVHQALAAALAHQRLFTAAFAHYGKAIELNANLVESHVSRALLALQTGDFERGWPELEWRFRRISKEQPTHVADRWDGKADPDARIMLIAEASFADTIQFARYATLVKKRCRSVVMRSPADWSKILRNISGIDEIVTADDAAQEVDGQIPLLSLPALFGTTLSAIPSLTPYLRVDIQQSESWKERLSSLAGYKVGIQWQSQGSLSDRRLNSIPIEFFAELAKVPEVRLISLAGGSDSRRILGIDFPATQFNDLDEDACDRLVDIAAIVQNLDLVITCDADVAHLAGALGKPVWVALPTVSNWRWLLNREDSPWYPGMRLFRQRRAGDWHEVFERIARGLSEFTAQKCEPQIHRVPKSALDHCMDGVELARLGRVDEALASFRNAVATDPGYAEGHNNLGNALRTVGEFNEAIQHLQIALRLNPDYPEAYHNLGIALAELGQHESAIAALRRCLSLRPDFPGALVTLGNALWRTTALDEAASCFQRALQLAPGLANAHCGLANVLAECGRSDDAIGHYRVALELQPGSAETLTRLGRVLRDKGESDKALSCFQRAVKSQPNFADAHNDLGITFSRLGKQQEAIEQYQIALRLRPGNAAVLNNLGISYANSSQFDLAISSYQQALAIQQDYAEAHNNLGIVLTQQGQYDAAFANYQRAIELRPDYPEAHSNFGISLSEYGRTEEALEHFSRALQLKPDYPDAHMNQSLTLLMNGDWEQGWREYEWRWGCKEFKPRQFSEPRWDGRPLDGKRLLLHTEQGLGDTLQFIRFARLVKELGATVIVRCPRPLVHLIRLCEYVDVVCIEGDVTPPFDVHLPLLSLPFLLGTRLDNLPNQVPYLRADERLVEYWQRQLSFIDAFKVGIGWQGNPKYRGDRHRSISLAHFASLAAVDNVRLISLQRGLGVEQIREARFSITELGSQIDEAAGAFMDTAAILKNLDMVITSDTSLAHLAGALGVPVWIALPWSADWRWLREREDCPWYPTMRLFRQRTLGDWSEVFQRLASGLRAASARKSKRDSIRLDVAASEVLDKIAGLEASLESGGSDLHAEALRSAAGQLRDAFFQRIHATPELHDLLHRLKQLHGDEIRSRQEFAECERQGDFGPKFVAAARKAYRVHEMLESLKGTIDREIGRLQEDST